ncbi:acyltransferase family protein [Mediterraneibacter gnavus]|uniref:acyltransferase family protein n=1 Tax=Mediterraneibacter gnavus TaxID=33038 RepID=UPI003D7DEE2E
MIPQYNFEWILSLFIEKVCFFAVPVFFMITGATLIDYPKRYNLKTYVKKRINKTVIPWLAWGGYRSFIT